VYTPGSQTARVEVGALRLRDRYGAREGHPHEMAFCKGVVDVEDGEHELEKAKAYLDDDKPLGVRAWCSAA